MYNKMVVWAFRERCVALSPRVPKDSTYAPVHRPSGTISLRSARIYIMTAEKTPLPEFRHTGNRSHACSRLPTTVIRLRTPSRGTYRTWEYVCCAGVKQTRAVYTTWCSDRVRHGRDTLEVTGRPTFRTLKNVTVQSEESQKKKKKDH